MQLDIPLLTALVRETLARPRDAALRVLRMDVPDDARWLAFVLVVVLSVLLGQASVLLMGEGGGIGGSLLLMAMFQSSVLLALVVGVQGIGRMAGGKGQFPDTLLLITWLQFVMLVFQIVQIVALVLVPPLFGVITILSLLVFLRTLASFVLVLHGFQSVVKVGVAILFSFFGIAMLLAIVLSILGFAPAGV
jgi:hypothetical protein